MHIPRILISSIRGGGGKTLLSLGLCRALTKKGHKVKPYKKGPDYIDAHWLNVASSAPCTNLDPFFLSSQRLCALFAHVWSQKSYTLTVTEGNRGLFDGQDVHGSCSTAYLAKTLQIPIILSLDITKMTRTSAAILQGIENFEQNIKLAGVVLNQVGSDRHENIVRQAIELYTDIPILGALPRLKENPLPERHMGLCQSHGEDVQSTLDSLGDFISQNCNIAQIIDIANNVVPLQPTEAFWSQELGQANSVRIGYIHDAAFWFYYEENLDALIHAGAELVPLSILDPKPWPQIDGLYIGGGYPEEFVQEISSSAHLEQIKAFSLANMPIYAECGGFMLLAKTLLRKGKSYTMSDVFPVATSFHSKPQGLGYVQGKVMKENAFHPLGQELRGHEFHYSKCQANQAQELNFCFSLDKGTGMGKLLKTEVQACDGLYLRQTFAAYSHIFAPSCPWWAGNFVNLAKKWKEKRSF